MKVLSSKITLLSNTAQIAQAGQMSSLVSRFGTSIRVSNPSYKLSSISSGLRGNPGLSAYEIALQNGFAGTEAEWLDSLVGPPGTAGDVAWGELIGSISDQADLFAILTALQDQITALQAGTIMTLNKIIKVDAVTAWTAFENYEATNLEVFNSSDVAIDIRRGGTGDFITLPALERKVFGGLTNSNQISVRRTDGVNTPISIQAEAWTQ